MRCWGYNNNAQLGNNSTTSSYTPVTVDLGGQRALQVTLGYYHTCALLATGEARCWGNNVSGQAGSGSTAEIIYTPAAVNLGGQRATQISSDYYHACAVLASGEVRCWGYNDYGQLGNGTTAARTPTPVSVNLGGAQAFQVSTGDYHTCAVLANYEVRCWGYNGGGQLGSGTTNTPQLTPISVAAPGNAGVSQIDADYHHTCAVINLSIYCWGYNGDGRVGDGTYTNRLTPVAVLIRKIDYSNYLVF